MIVLVVAVLVTRMHFVATCKKNKYSLNMNQKSTKIKASKTWALIRKAQIFPKPLQICASFVGIAC